MNDRIFRVLLGFVLIAALYLEINGIIYGLIGLLLFEGTTNLRTSMLLIKPQKSFSETVNGGESQRAEMGMRLTFEAERALRLVVAVFLIVGIVFINTQIWFLPWFVGFALVGAGLSGICPMVLALKRIGFQ